MASARELALLQSLQDDFPLVERPFLAAGEKFGLSERQALAVLRRFHKDTTIRYLGAIFDPSRLGVSSALCCCDVPASRVARAAGAVSAFPQVSHNYLRDGHPNLWFTLSARSPSALRGLLGRVRAAAGEDVRALPAVRTFKIDARFSVGGGLGRRRSRGRRGGRARFDKGLVVELNKPFAFVSRPFRARAAACGMSESALLGRVRAYEASGLIRRFGVILGHRKAGLKVNCMAAWVVPAARVASAGRRFASYRQVTHCYERAVFPGWPYNVYTMVHCRSRRECLALLAEMAAGAGVKGCRPLFTVREYKKTKADLASVL